MKTIALLLLLASQSGLRSTTLCTGDNPLDCLPPPAICGDGIIHPTEACDDGNRIDNDGCSMDCKRSSVVAARYRFDRTGTLDLPPGMPQPTFDCRLDKWSGTGNLVCNGTNPVTFTPSGNPTAGVPTYWRPGGGSTAGSSVGFGAGNRFATTDSINWGKFSFCAVFTTAMTDPSAETILAKDDGSTSRVFSLRWDKGANKLNFFMRDAANALFVVSQTIIANDQIISCGSLEAGGTMSLNTSGNVAADVPAPATLPANLSASLTIGAMTNGAYAANGSIPRVVFWSGHKASAADLAYIVNSMTGKRGTNNESLTVTRANAQSVVLKNSDAEPFVTNVPANQLAIGQNGAEIYGARTSRIPWNQRSSANNAVGGISGTSSTWVIRGTATCTLSPDPAPDGTMTAERCTLGGAGNDIYVLGSGYTGSAVLAVSTWIKPVTASGVLTYRNTNTGLGAWTIDMSALSKWTRIYTGSGNYTQSEAWTTTGGGGSGAQFLFIDGVSRIVDIWRPWQVEGAIAGPDAEVQGSLVPLAATVASTTAHGLTNGSQWCVSAIATPEGRAWALPNAAPTSGLEVLWATGAADTANSVRLAAFHDGKLYFKIVDASNGIKTAAYTHGFAAGSSHRIVACSDNGTLSMAIDGTTISSTITGTGTGVVSSHGTLTVGRATNIQATTGYNGVWNGSIREVVTCNTSNPALCR